METRHLIDGIVRQTTVLVAQLSTVAGIRAPLSRVADQVFLNLARELEAQGVGRKVVVVPIVAAVVRIKPLLECIVGHKLKARTASFDSKARYDFGNPIGLFLTARR